MHLITACGTGEQPNGVATMWAGVSQLLGDVVTWTPIDYPASIACFNPTGSISGASEAISRAEGVAAMVAAIRATDDRVIIGGYSLGALVVSDLLAAIARGEYPDLEIDVVVNLANPGRAEGESYGLPSTGFGLDGQHPAWPAGIPVYEIANPADAITSAPADSPWRMAADAIRTFNISVEGIESWVSSMIAQMDGRQQVQAQAHLFDAAWWAAYAAAPGQLYGYALGGEHTNGYQRAQWFNASGSRVTGQQLAAEVVASFT